ncbi:S-layer homology domain-containing protein [Salimicrobium sp. PL1-032A]|uniref:S-layer homology domain-containing protein n=1 Tax=Salimicrobium sp. PL1-032A TaxID=3095364 RepID=UPI003260C72D
MDPSFGAGLAQAPEEPFTDVTSPGQWFYEDVRNMYTDDYITGFRDATFRPNVDVTREETVTFFGRVLDLDGTKRPVSFSDVEEGFYSSGYIASAVEEGIIVGMTEERFAPKREIIRGDAALILKRAFDIPDTDEEYFSDVEEEYYAGAVNAIASAGIAEGYPDGTFRQEQSLTRAELVRILSVAKNMNN